MNMKLWYPPVCPSGQCVFALELNPDGTMDYDGNNQTAMMLCPHHQSVLASNGLDDPGIHRAIVRSTRTLSAARAAVKAELGLDKEHPGVPFRINPDGSLTVLTDAASLVWGLEDGSTGPLPTINAAARNRARSSALIAIGLSEQSVGSSVVTVE